MGTQKRTEVKVLLVLRNTHLHTYTHYRV